MTKLSELNLPTLDGGWITLKEAADRLGLTRSYIYKKVANGDFTTAHRIGAEASYIVNASEVDAMLNHVTPPVETEAELQVEEEIAAAEDEAIHQAEVDKEESPVEQPKELSIDEMLQQL